MTSKPSLARTLLPAARGITWHRPLMWLAVAMAVSTLACAIGMLVDPRSIGGLPLWDKPFKFSLSVAIYASSWSYLLGQVRRARRTAWWAGTVAAAGLALEMVGIIGQAARDTTSHFNVSTPLDAAVYSMMGVTIVFVWSATLVVSVLLFASPGPDRARNLAVRYGTLLSLIGMSLGYLMTIPTKAQLAPGAHGGIMGAHTVGLPDGGPGLPLLGWSTVGGDLRIPHFVGLHALQVIPLVLLALELWTPFSAAVRARLVHVAAAGYAGLIAVITVQALRGQSIVHPDSWTLLQVAVLAVGVAVGVVAALRPTGVRAGVPTEGPRRGVELDRPVQA